MQVEISIRDLEQVQDLIAVYPARVKKASRRSVNLTAKRVSTESSRNISRDYTIKQRELKANIKRKLARGSNPNAYIDFFKEFMPLDKFRHNGRLGVRRKKGLLVQVRKGRKTLYNGAFLGSTAGGLKIFKREGKLRLPIKRLLGPAISQMVTKENLEQMELSAKERFLNAFNHEMLEGFRYGRGRR